MLWCFWACRVKVKGKVLIVSYILISSSVVNCVVNNYKYIYKCKFDKTHLMQKRPGPILLYMYNYTSSFVDLFIRCATYVDEVKMKRKKNRAPISELRIVE